MSQRLGAGVVLSVLLGLTACTGSSPSPQTPAGPSAHNTADRTAHTATTGSADQPSTSPSAAAPCALVAEDVVERPSDAQYTALRQAMLDHNPSAVLEAGRASKKWLERGDDTVLLTLIADRNCPELVAPLVNAGADPTKNGGPNSSYSTPLHVAVLRRNKEMVAQFIAHGADPNAEKPNQLHVLVHPGAEPDAEMISVLLKNGMKVPGSNEKHMNGYLGKYLCDGENLPTFKKLVQAMSEPRQENLLLAAVIVDGEWTEGLCRNQELLRFLVASGWDPDKVVSAKTQQSDVVTLSPKAAAKQFNARAALEVFGD